MMDKEVRGVLLVICKRGKETSRWGERWRQRDAHDGQGSYATTRVCRRPRVLNGS